MRTVPVVAWRALRQRAQQRAGAASSIWRAASAMASAATVGITPRPVRSNSGAPSCASSSAMWRLSVGCCALSLRAAPIRLPASSTATKLFTSAQLKAPDGAADSVMQECIARMPTSAIVEWLAGGHTEASATRTSEATPCTPHPIRRSHSCSAPTAASALPPCRRSPPRAGACWRRRAATPAALPAGAVHVALDVADTAGLAAAAAGARVVVLRPEPARTRAGRPTRCR